MALLEGRGLVGVAMALLEGCGFVGGGASLGALKSQKPRAIPSWCLCLVHVYQDLSSQLLFSPMPDGLLPCSPPRWSYTHPQKL